MKTVRYARAMSDQTPYVSLRLNTRDPIALGHFVSTFTALGSEYERFIRSSYPDLAPTASVYLRQIKEGSIIAELVGWAMAAGAIGINSMEQALIIEEFVRRYGERLGAYLNGKRLPDPSKTELKEFMSQLSAIANDPNGTAEIEAICFEDGRRKVKARAKFNTRSARRASAGLSEHLNDLQKSSTADHTSVLLRYVRPSIEGGSGAKRGERGRIGSLYDKALPIVYASDLARQQIQHELEAMDGNVFQLLFEVDVNVELNERGTPQAYRITHLHQVHEDEG